MSSVSGLFTGSSTYSNDFTQVINRAVQIASLPIVQLTSEKNTLSSEQTALSNLASSFTSLQSAVTSLNTAADTSQYAVSYSDSTVAIASASSGALPGTYTIDVVDPGTQARANSLATVADPSKNNISTATSFTLTINGKTYANIQPASATLNSLADAINTATAGDAQATVVNTGTNISPSYQLSIRNSKYGTSTMTLTGDAGNLLGTPSAATSVQYRINGQPAAQPLSTDTRTLTVAPNVSVTVLKAGTTDVTVGNSTSALVNALNTFVSAYNSVTNALDAHRGSSDGPLSGQTIITTLAQTMGQITGYSGTGSVRSISDIGLTFDKNGVLSFDASTLNAAAGKDFKGVTEFLGSTGGTSGFLKTANDCLTSVNDVTSGVVAAASTSVADQITNTDTQIGDAQDRVDQMQQNLNAQMAAADALIASLQQQVTYFTSMFEAMRTNQASLNG